MASYEVGMYVPTWAIPDAGSPVTISGAAVYYNAGGHPNPCPAGITIVVAVRNNSTGVTNTGSVLTDQNGNFSYTVPGSWHASAGSYAMYVYMMYLQGQTIGGDTYVPTDSGYYHSYVITVATFNTRTSLVLFKGGDNTKPLATSVSPGDPLFLETLVSIHNPGGANDGYLISNADVYVMLSFPDGTRKNFMVTTDAYGYGWYDLSGMLAATTASNMGFGRWTFGGSFPGATRGNQIYNPSDSVSANTNVIEATCTPACVDGEQWECYNGLFQDSGETCLPANDLLLLGAVAGLAAVGVIIIAGSRKRKG